MVLQTQIFFRLEKSGSANPDCFSVSIKVVDQKNRWVYTINYLFSICKTTFQEPLLQKTCKKVHLQGPCSLRPCSSRPYCFHPTQTKLTKKENVKYVMYVMYVIYVTSVFLLSLWQRLFIFRTYIFHRHKQPIFKEILLDDTPRVW